MHREAKKRRFASAKKVRVNGLGGLREESGGIMGIGLGVYLIYEHSQIRVVS